MEMQNTMKRLDENRIAADGLIWDNRADKAIKVKNLDSGNIVHSIKLESISYYPVSIDKSNKNKNYIEVPISYKARSYEAGKKIKLIDGFKYLFAIFKYRF